MTECSATPPRKLRDPALAGIKVVKTPLGQYVLKCKALCNGPNGRPAARVDSLQDAHDWAMEHRQKFPDHEKNWELKQST